MYTAVTTMLTFPGQVLRADRSCQQAVNGLIAQQVAADQAICSADTSGYCKARQRLPVAMFWELQRQTGSAVEDEAPHKTRWCGRRVRVVVTRLPVSRQVDFRKGQRLGKDDVLITWRRTFRPDWLTREEAAAVPDTLTLRAVRVQVRRPGFRTKVVIVLTTLLDPQAYPARQIAELYRRRWQAEVNLRSLKTHMGMEQLRTRRPETIRKEFAMHLIAYNGVRRLGALAAREAGVQAWSISFKGALQTLNEFLPRLRHTRYAPWLHHLLHTAEQIRVDRRDRVEPYATRQRPKEYPFLNEPRACYKNRVSARG
jgi:hypothetical protein